MDGTFAGAPSSSQTIGWDIFDTQVQWPDQFDQSKIPGVYELKAGFLAALFRGWFRALRVNVDPKSRQFNAVCLETPGGVYQVRVMSAIRPGEHYEFNWVFGPPQPNDIAGTPCGNAENRVVQAPRRKGSDATDTANVAWLVAPEQTAAPIKPEDMNIGIYCRKIGERITLTLGNLSITYHQTAVDKEAAIVPWRAVLHWMSEVGRVDQVAYERVPERIRFFFGRDLSWKNTTARLQGLTMNDVVGWQRQGLLPGQLPRMEDGYIPELRLSVQLQQRIAHMPDLQLIYNEAPWPFPRLVLSLPNVEQLQPVDLQALMTIGALREMRRRSDDLIDEMAKTDSRARALVEGGFVGQLRDKPEFALFLSDEQVLKEKEDEADIARRRRDNYDMSKREFLRRNEFQQALAGIQVQVANTFDPQQGMAQFAAIRRYYMSAPPWPGSPPWKIYEPYMV